MEKVKISSKTAKIRVFSNYPSFQYYFEEADTPQLVDEKHSEKILKNPNFYISKQSIAKPKKVAQKALKQEKSWFIQLEEINGIGNKTAKDIIKIYPNKGLLLRDIADKKELPFRDDIGVILNKVFIH